MLIIVQNPKWTNAVGIIYGILCIIGILATLAAAVMVIYYRDNIVIKRPGNKDGHVEVTSREICLPVFFQLIS